ncbi:hypothetical protein [Halocatena marina]|uniref:Uncharacterized protein n=1 Tax=Halocatena marina TaxID=2934937 RepID=A0ABD5YNC0_9EURY|nr:hypothetical protein [Halocatena marina]
MNPRKRLGQNLIAESKAYGYTLTIWGSGVILFHHYGTPGILHILSYVGGALVAFAILAFIAFDALFSDVDKEKRPRLIAMSMIHIFASFGNLLVSHIVVVAAVALTIPTLPTFLLIGFQATFTYNILLLVEEGLE